MNKNLDIYFSDACNSNCQYCIMRDLEHDNNAAIRQALQDGTFAAYARKALDADTTSIGFWGKEPSINGQYFSSFVTNLLDYSPYIRYIMIPTNGQSNSFYYDFIWPLLAYCNTHKRKLILNIQLSLDGPAELQDKYRGVGSTQQCKNLIDRICNIFPFENQYLRLRMSTKSTLCGADLETFPMWPWRKFMMEMREASERHFIYKEDCRIGYPQMTVELPGNYTAAQGRALVRWKKYFKIDSRSCGCAAGVNSKTIDYQGNLYDCHLLVNRNFDLSTLRVDFEQKMNGLVAAGEAIEQDRDKLFNAIMSIYCWATANNDIPESYIRLLGNGVLL